MEQKYVLWRIDLIESIMELNITIKAKDKIIADLKKSLMWKAVTTSIIIGNSFSVVYHTFVELCKLTCISVKDYFVKFFESIASGRTDYENLLPTTIGLKQ